MFLMFKKFFFYWGIVVLQCCISFYCTAKWTSMCYSRFLLVIYFIHTSVYMSIHLMSSFTLKTEILVLESSLIL